MRRSRFKSMGLGHVTPNLNGKTLAVGQVINLRAIPGSGQVFAGWSGLPGATAAAGRELVLGWIRERWSRILFQALTYH